MYPLDELDRRLLSALRVNGREPVASLTHDLGVTRSTITSRLKRLIDSGTVVGFCVRIREDRDPNSIRAITLIEVEGRDEPAAQLGVERGTSGNPRAVPELRIPAPHRLTRATFMPAS
ncbi:Lrp/AsnC family transcriptional regulator [Cryobacterium sp. TMT3-29-2]|uniref:Lrp/AsnC family transcriptional regulator n=1 Tax=Cryobacterium sp. TMT3-29-2 TaxID=2555867 RepID=UPI0010738D0D|nr:Lrp/AsnC family transcriptional regulator [Cryobacterium sp. TMT3-29-2]TFC94151.1 Lrp/AsnC family transcriptional regulator [Cryobacterium sp. TMT3-29-2]